MKKIAFWLMLVLTFFSIIGGIEVLQFIPLAIYLFLAYLNIWDEQKNGKFILGLAILMAVLNIAVLSFVDVVMWALVTYAHWGEQ